MGIRIFQTKTYVGITVYSGSRKVTFSIKMPVKGQRSKRLPTEEEFGVFVKKAKRIEKQLKNLTRRDANIRRLTRETNPDKRHQSLTMTRVKGLRLYKEKKRNIDGSVRLYSCIVLHVMKNRKLKTTKIVFNKNNFTEKWANACRSLCLFYNLPKSSLSLFIERKPTRKQVNAFLCANGLPTI